MSSDDRSSNASRYKLMSQAKLPISRSSSVTIPPGLSPSSVLESPILPSHVKVEPSPTTGSFVKPLKVHEIVGPATLMSTKESSSSNTCDERNTGNSKFIPLDKPGSRSSLSSLGPRASAGSKFQQYEPFVGAEDQSLPKSFASSHLFTSEQALASSRDLVLSVDAPYPAVDLFNSNCPPPADIDSGNLQQSKGTDIEVQAFELEQKEAGPSIAGEKSSDDGYSWRKYGQKHVKGSEFPRSYYKCTFPNCQVKKLLESSLDGKISEIIYKGTHDHPKPQPKRRYAVGTALSIPEESPENLTSSEGKTFDTYGQTSYQSERNGLHELPPVTSDDEHGGDDNNDEDDPESKRSRKQDFGGVNLATLITPTRDQRVVVQTISEVDILEDGYRWRKYGQKVVKGNPNPRSYYKCTNVGCQVRKQVERASHDPRAVITTYEGKHNHDVPAGRTSSHFTAGAGTCMTTMEPVQRTTFEGNDTISLDLGFGISLSAEDGSYKKLPNKADHEQILIEVSSPDCCHAAPVTAYSTVNQYEVGEKQGETFSFHTQHLDLSSNPYLQSMGSLLMGP